MNDVTLAGITQITSWDESTHAQHDNDSKQTLAKIKQTYSGDVEGQADINYVMSYQPDGTAVFVGFEHLTIDTEVFAGSIVLQHCGGYSQGVAHSKFSVVVNSGTHNLQGYIGSGEFTSTENGQANYVITLTSPTK